MSKKIIKPLDISVKPLSWNFWWSLYDLEPLFEELLHIYSMQRISLNYTAHLITKGCFTYFSETPDNKEAKYLNQNAEYWCEKFGRTLEEMAQVKSIIYTPNVKPSEAVYDEFKNAIGKPYKITRFAIFHHADYITRQSLEAAVTHFCRDFCGVHQFIRLELTDQPSLEEAAKSFQFEQEQKRKSKEFIASGGKYRGVILVPVLTTLFGEDEVARFKGNIDYGYLSDDGRVVYVKLKDGSERQIGKPFLKLVE